MLCLVNSTKFQYFQFYHKATNESSNRITIKIADLMHECCPQHLHIGRERMNEDEEMEKDSKLRRDGERGTVGK